MGLFLTVVISIPRKFRNIKYISEIFPDDFYIVFPYPGLVEDFRSFCNKNNKSKKIDISHNLGKLTPKRVRHCRFYVERKIKSNESILSLK